MVIDCKKRGATKKGGSWSYGIVHDRSEEIDVLYASRFYASHGKITWKDELQLVQRMLRKVKKWKRGALWRIGERSRIGIW
jgi:hypothetical protein